MIYQTTNIVNNKIYIGIHKTDDINDSYLGSGRRLIKAIKKYGKTNFIRDILFIYDNATDAFNKEIQLVDNSFLARKDVYNLVPGGMGYAAGRKMSQKFKNRCRERMLGNTQLLGHKHSEITRKRMSISSRGKSKSLEHRRKLSESAKKKPKMSEETKNKISRVVKRQHARNKLLKLLGLDGIASKDFTKATQLSAQTNQ